nr:phosphotransferase [Propionicimonas sp.]
MDAEQPLAGGNMGPVTRVGDEVRRSAGPWTPNVHRLLNLFADAGIAETPRPLGFTDDGRERLTYLAGTVPSYPRPDLVWSASVLVDAARLLRRLHDASVPLAGVRDGWRSPVREPADVVCHNDFAPYNLVFADGRLAGVIDFDYCSPGPRIWDLAYLAYRLAPLTGPQEPGGPVADAERASRLTRLIEAYGLPVGPAELVAVVVERLLALAAFSDDAAARLGNPELRAHAAGYRADAERLAAWRVPFAGNDALEKSARQQPAPAEFAG